MKALDLLLQKWRIAKAIPWVRSGDRLLDVGCYDDSLIERVRPRIASATGVDAVLNPREEGNVRLLRGLFPDDFDFPEGSFDCISLLAVLEHVPNPEDFAAACYRVLAPEGRVVLTVPHPLVDRILDVLMWLRLVDGMATEEHHGFDVGETVPLFESAGFALHAEERFQLGLNRLFVFEKGGAGSS